MTVKDLCEEKVPKKPFATNTSSATAAGTCEYLYKWSKKFSTIFRKEKISQPFLNFPSKKYI